MDQERLELEFGELGEIGTRKLKIVYVPPHKLKQCVLLVDLVVAWFILKAY